jgi:hypothetical protein
MNSEKRVREVIDLIDYVATKQDVRIQINRLPAEVIHKVADHYGLHVFEPEEHPMTFTFCKGYVRNGRVVVGRKNADGAFSLSDLTDLPEEVFL